MGEILFPVVVSYWWNLRHVTYILQFPTYYAQYAV